MFQSHTGMQGVDTSSPAGQQWRRMDQPMLHPETGQSLVELALALPIFLLLLLYTVDFGYYFLVAAVTTSSARNAVEYATQGFSAPSGAYSSPSLPSPPPAGDATKTNSVVSLALRDVYNLVNSSTKTTVQVCSSTVGTTGTVSCKTWGATSTSWTPDTDPESSEFQLFRVDVQYTVSPPIDGSFMGHSLVPTYTFHRMAEMRAMN